MASFSNNSHPLLTDSVFSQNKQNVISGFIDETESISFNWFNEFERSMFVHNSDNDLTSVIKKQKIDESTMVDHKLENGERIVTLTMGKKKRTRNGVPLNSSQSKDAKEGKNKRQKKGLKIEKKEEAPNGYIHVRARRGEATDRHSLAERVRRKKISERMTKLQRMVPGCDQISGKAHMLDAIINYIESLQNQVEFLSMKAATSNTMFYGVDLEALMVKPDLQIVNNISSSPTMAYLEQCNTTQPIRFVDTTTFAPSNYNNNLLDTSSSATLLLNQGHMPTLFSPSQDKGSLLWEVEYLRQ